MLRVGAMEVSYYQYHQHKNTYHMGWVVGWSIINYFNLISQTRDAIGLVVDWFVINYFAKESRTLINYCLELMRINLIVYSMLVQLWVAGERPNHRVVIRVRRDL